MKKIIILLLVLIAGIFYPEKATEKSLKGLPTFLKITVLNDMGEAEEGTKIQLFETEQDYNKESNPVNTRYTNKRGKTTFGKLRPTVYYILARKEGMNNDLGAVKTDTLREGLINKVTVIIR
ncbi:carboxypeptidase regulatory-like domain-containing protein [Xanthovirga aplysinae]|uniref:carboxypeptidase regulatory-like domain-containing protein n=1 Tax=Xanthovirga aplysinae TaxID=2529853 RepID=UPI0012BB4B00|nr:carboxypeptidase regulatory-like domain-containing protein [Xanthovirga aplysinae]MTI30847.1 carboxypeptidase regulatory-like domain-containing protein [Xanthovirga aplysinae]